MRTAHTTLGAVAYRVLGSGTPLVMITGYGATMEGWDRRLVDALARHYRVVIFDNAGIGATQALPAPLSIDAMPARPVRSSPRSASAARTSSAGRWAA